MTRRQKVTTEPLFLGVECGGTRTTVVLTEYEPTCFLQSKFGPANLRLLSDAQLVQHFRPIGNSLPKPTAIVIGMAGARTEADRERIRRAAAKVWPGVLCYATNDLELAIVAADSLSDHPRFRHLWKKHPEGGRYMHGRHSDAIGMIPRVLVLSGTGSCCFGRTWDGKTAKVGGWGHILGDKGSGFEIGLRALKAVVYYYDCEGAWSKLGQQILRKLQLNAPDDLIDWVRKAGKDEVAALAVEVFNAWSHGDKIASDILEGAAHGLAADAVSCAKRLGKTGAPVQFVLAGGVLLKQPRFAKKVAQLLRRCWPNAIVTPLERESVWGAVELAKRQFQTSGSRRRVQQQNRPAIADRGAELEFPSLESLKLSPTEQRNPRSINLDKLSIAETIALMLGEDEKIPPAILAERTKIEQAIEWIVRAFKRGGRLFYVGAGTSGRLGVLDASECPPTFRAPPELVQGIIAGGQRALWESIEGAEDDPMAGAGAIQFRGVNRKDVVIGIAASGRTPFVWGALGAAKERGAKTILLCFNPRLEIPRRIRPNLVIAPNVGPEILTGSTRLKSGTATKLILNIFTTVAMVQSGKVIGNLMVDVNPGNVKLRDRAVRIVRELTGVDETTAQESLEKSGWVVKQALRRLRPSP